MNLKNAKADYFSGKISKSDYIDSMFSNHQRLYDYADFLEETDISRIEITDKNAVIETGAPS